MPWLRVALGAGVQGAQRLNRLMDLLQRQMLADVRAGVDPSTWLVFHRTEDDDDGITHHSLYLPPNCAQTLTLLNNIEPSEMPDRKGLGVLIYGGGPDPWILVGGPPPIGPFAE